MRNIILSIALLLLSVSECLAVLSVQVSPASATHVTSPNLPIMVTWDIVDTVPLPDTIFTSTIGVFRAPTGIGALLPNSGTVLGSTINTPVSIGCGDVAGCTAKIENFIIPADVLSDANSRGLTTIFYNRSFADGIDTVVGRMQINLIFPVESINNPPGLIDNPQSKLRITREALRFSDNSTRKLINANTNLSAIADLKYTGSGLFDAFWEYSSPLSATGKPVFTPLSTVRRYLGIGGRVILQSPSLPTNVTGEYFVRLNILKTATNPNGVEFTKNLPDNLPILRYTVIKPDADKNNYSLPPIKTDTPYDNTVLQPDTRFNWQAVTGATAYQLELFLVTSQPVSEAIPSTLRINESVLLNKRPAAGLLIPAKETSLSLSVLAKDMLRQQQSYYWRIIAIGKNGEILSTSSIKTIKIQ